MKLKSTLMDREAVFRSLRRITHEIIEKNKGTDNLCLVGILSRGADIAEIIAQNIKTIEGVAVNVGFLDIYPHRDDLDNNQKEYENKTDSSFSIEGKTVVLVDDV